MGYTRFSYGGGLGGIFRLFPEYSLSGVREIWKDGGNVWNHVRSLDSFCVIN